MNLELLEKEIGYSLPENLTADIPFQAGFQLHEKELSNKNRFYVNWGHSIIQSACGIFLYLTNSGLTKNELIKQTKTICQAIEVAVYKKYWLKRFVIKRSGCNGNYPEISSKIIVLLYIEHGFLPVYKFLVPFFENLISLKESVYNKIISNYANYKKLQANNVITETGDLDKAKKYLCRITVGNQYAEATAESKQEAKIQAEKNFISAHRRFIPQNIIKNPTPNKKISEDRKRQIEDAVRILHLTSDFFTYEEMDKALTHSSFINQSPFNNSVLSFLGGYLFSMLSFEYLYGETRISADIRTTLIQKKNTVQYLSDDYLKYLLVGSIKVSEEIRIDMKTEVFLSILASLWQTSVYKPDENIAAYAKKLGLRLLVFSDPENRINFITFIKKVAKIFGLGISIESLPDYDNSDSSITYTKVITLASSKWVETGMGAEEKEDAALEKAAKDVLEKLLEHCSNNSDTAIAIRKMLDGTFIILPKNNDEKGIEKEENAHLIPPPSPSPPSSSPPPLLPPPPPPPPRPRPLEVSFDRSENILYICKGTIACERKKHKIESVTGILASLAGKPVKINIHYCPSCNIYFIDQDTYLTYRDRYGTLMGNFAFPENHSSKGTGSDNWEAESVLKICGYTVEKGVGLSENERWYILKNVMLRKILPKHRIESYLEFFIRINKNVKNKQLAVQKWETDLAQVRNFDLDRQRHVWINKIRKAH